jgi:hypothetical protein
VYLDGAPIAMLRYAELPSGLAPVWETQRSRLPFKPGEAVRYRETHVRRYRVTDYLRALGVELDSITEVHLHGARDTAIVLTRAQLLAQPDDILFKFSGETFGKPVPMLRNIDAGTSFDDLSALTIYRERTPPTRTENLTLELDGHEVRGIAYHGDPMREGVRVYVDDRLATTLKRNQLATQEHWQLGEVLSRAGVTATIRRAVLIHDEQRTDSPADLSFAFNPGASGEILVGSSGLPANAIALYTQDAPGRAR